jgi:hypothetical protein
MINVTCTLFKKNFYGLFFEHGTFSPMNEATGFPMNRKNVYPPKGNTVEQEEETFAYLKKWMLPNEAASGTNNIIATVGPHVGLVLIHTYTSLILYDAIQELILDQVSGRPVQEVPLPLLFPPFPSSSPPFPPTLRPLFPPHPSGW